MIFKSYLLIIEKIINYLSGVNSYKKDIRNCITGEICKRLFNCSVRGDRVPTLSFFNDNDRNIVEIRFNTLNLPY